MHLCISTDPRRSTAFGFGLDLSFLNACMHVGAPPCLRAHVCVCVCVCVCVRVLSMLACATILDVVSFLLSILFLQVLPSCSSSNEASDQNNEKAFERQVDEVKKRPVTAVSPQPLC